MKGLIHFFFFLLIWISHLCYYFVLGEIFLICHIPLEEEDYA